MNISHFIAKRRSFMVKKLIRWAYYTEMIVVLSEMVLSCFILGIIAKIQGHESQAISDYLIWSIPLMIAGLCFEGIVILSNSLMKAFNYIWLLLVLNVATMVV